MELIVVLSVTVVLAGLFLPTMARMRETANKIVSASNLRQIGMSLLLYANEHREQIPTSVLIADAYTWQPHELMSAYIGGSEWGWDGFGRLYELGFCDCASVFYSPSHRGDHPYERYASIWERPGGFNDFIYTNYHYAGHVDWVDKRPRRLTDDDLVLASDGLRTRSDLNHTDGLHLLSVDGSVQWEGELDPLLAILKSDPPSNAEERAVYGDLWTILESFQDR